MAALASEIHSSAPGPTAAAPASTLTRMGGTRKNQSVITAAGRRTTGLLAESLTVADDPAGDERARWDGIR